MEDTSSVRSLLPRLARRPPADLTAVLVVTALVNLLAFTPGLRETPLRVPVGLAFVLFVPGYAVVSAVFPQRGPTNRFTGAGAAAEPPRSWWGRIDGIDRIALSITLSVVVVPVIGVVATAEGGFEFAPTLLAVSAFTALATLVASWRRWAVPPDDRFRVPYREWLTSARTAVLEPDTRGEMVLNVALLGTVLLALVSVGYAATVLPPDDEFSAIYVLPEDGDPIDGENSSLEIEAAEPQEITVGIDNHEGAKTTYTVVVVEQELDGAPEDGEPSVTEQRELDRFDAEVADDETWRHDHTVEPTMGGENARVAWLLYVDGDAPTEPSIESADYHSYAWVGENADDSGE